MLKLPKVGDVVRVDQGLDYVVMLILDIVISRRIAIVLSDGIEYTMKLIYFDYYVWKKLNKCESLAWEL